MLPAPAATTSSAQPRLSFLDRWLPLLVLAAMVLGLGVGQLLPGLGSLLASWTVGSVSVPIAVGLLVMMYPPLAQVRYDQVGQLLQDRKLMGLSLTLNWVLGPALMFALAWIFMPDLPEYRTGLVVVGLARCIAMVLIWNDLACGDREAGAVLVAVNAVFQVLMFGVLGWFYLQFLPGLLGLPRTSAEFSFWSIVTSVLVFLGVPLLAGAVSRAVGERISSRARYEDSYLPKISPLALVGLLLTIVLLFVLQGDRFLAEPTTVLRVAAPMVLYFILVFGLGLFLAHAAHLGYARSTTVAFTAAGNNFELAIAVSVGTFGATSGQALAGTVGPLVEVPVLLGLVYILRWLGPYLFGPSADRAQSRTRHWDE